MNLLDFKKKKKGQQKTYSLMSLTSFRYGEKTAALNKCMMIFCLLFIFGGKKQLFLLTSTVSVSETVLWSYPAMLTGLWIVKRIKKKKKRGILNGISFFFFCVCISLLLWSNQPLLLWPLLCNWLRVICFNASTARTCIYLQIKRNIYRICQHMCSVCFVCLCCLHLSLWSGRAYSCSRTNPFPPLFTASGSVGCHGAQ